ncbi:hypothetical protein Tco_0859008 [Tanacetum coccineum]|uniref:Uncharacterized protein n=1 Tax=Tanacetum coccineum TaxID=301880 RepID=A0ABQ5BBJ1_9ASTR
MNESWQSCYKRTNSGKLVRQASTAVCILNEMRDLRSQLIDSIGSILHEYLSPEIWNLPLEQSNVVTGDINFHFFHDNAMLHQVMIDGIGIFNLSLKSDFVSSGFLHSSLYVLLENLICSNFKSNLFCPTLMRSILQELEILGRHQHPELTTSFLKVEVILDYVVTYFILRQVDDVDHSSLEDNADNKYKEQLEAVFFKLKEIKSYIRTVGSISISCITAATPLLSSLKQTTCLIALDIVENRSRRQEPGRSYKQVTRTRAVLIEALQSHSLHDLADTLDAENDGTDENRLLPVMNKIWLFLIACIRNRKPLVKVAVLEMIAEISGNKKSASAYRSVVKKEAISSPPPVEDLPPLFQLVPPPSSPKSYLYVQYGGQSYGF